MREHIVSWGGYNRQTDRVNAKVEASLNLRFAESGTKREGRKLGNGGKDEKGEANLLQYGCP